MKTSEFTWANMILFSVVPCEHARKTMTCSVLISGRLADVIWQGLYWKVHRSHSCIEIQSADYSVK